MYGWYRVARYDCRIGGCIYLVVSRKEKGGLNEINCENIATIDCGLRRDTPMLACNGGAYLQKDGLS